MRRLVIDTASRACSVALFEDLECIAAIHEVIGRGHAERLVPMIAELPDKGLADIISVNVGPGSFTGIRVGISAARALGLAWNARCEGYNGLQLLAAMARKKMGNNAPVDVAILGGHGEFFTQPFGKLGEPLRDACSLTPELASEFLKCETVAGDAAEKLIALRGFGIAIEVQSDARFWNEIANSPPLSTSAVYVRGPDAKMPGAR